MPLLLPLICLAGMGIALYLRSGPAGPEVPDDAPARLLRWAVGLLPAQRAEWGQAMLGELACIDGRARRWRFAAGCAGAALLLPPWGRAGVPAWAMAAVAAGGAGLYAFVAVRNGLGTSDRVIAVIGLALLAGYALGASALLRQPAVALPGLLGGVLLALAWLTPDGFTFYGLLVAIPPHWVRLADLVVLPVLAGAAGTLYGGSAAAGRRIARLAAFSAGLYVFLYATIAVAVIGAAGDQVDATWTVRASIADRLGNNGVFYLWFLPLTTAALGWAAAAATTSLRPRPAAAAPVPATSAGVAGEPSGGQAPHDDGRAAPARGPRRTARRQLTLGLVAAIVVLVAVTLLAG